MKENSNIRIGIIGAGRIGSRHIEEILKHNDTELVGVCDIKEKDKCIPNIDVPYTTSLEEMVLLQKPDVIHVCTPNNLHFPHALMALQLGCHVVVEKPLALDSQNCKILIEESQKVGKHIFTVMQNRYSPPSQWIKSLIDQKTLGDIYMIDIQCYWNRNEQYYQQSDWKGDLEKDGGTIFTQFSHFIDIMYWLFGDIENISANFANYNHKSQTEFEDSGHVIFNFIKGGSGSFSFSTSVHHKNYQSGMTIVAEKGTVKIGGQYMNDVEYCEIEGYSMPDLDASNGPNDYGHYTGSASNHHYVIDNVVNTLRGIEEIETPAEEGLKVVNIIERMYVSGNRNKVIRNIEENKSIKL